MLARKQPLATHGQAPLAAGAPARRGRANQGVWPVGAELAARAGPDTGLGACEVAARPGAPAARCCWRVGPATMARGLRSAHGRAAAGRLDGGVAAGGCAVELSRGTVLGLLEQAGPWLVADAGHFWPRGAGSRQHAARAISSLLHIMVCSCCFEISCAVVKVGCLNDPVAANCSWAWGLITGTVSTQPAVPEGQYLGCSTHASCCQRGK